MTDTPSMTRELLDLHERTKQGIRDAYAAGIIERRAVIDFVRERLRDTPIELLIFAALEAMPPCSDDPKPEQLNMLDPDT